MFTTVFLNVFLQSPRNGEDLSDAEGDTEQHDDMPRESSPEDGHGGQVRVKVISHIHR